MKAREVKREKLAKRYAHKREEMANGIRVTRQFRQCDPSLLVIHFTALDLRSDLLTLVSVTLRKFSRFTSRAFIDSFAIELSCSFSVLERQYRTTRSSA